MIQRWSLARVTWIGLAIIVLANAVALGGAAYNRMGEPESRIVLTQRELTIESDRFRSENSGMTARLDWCAPDSTALAEGPTRQYRFACDSRTPDWLNGERLAALGFDLRVDGPADASGRYTRTSTREAFVVLDVRSEWLEQAIQRARALLVDREAVFPQSPDSAKVRAEVENLRRRVDWLEHSASRLYVIDAGPRLDALRAKYPDRSRYAILRGKISAHVRRGDFSEPDAIHTVGEIRSIQGDRFNVPARYQRTLALNEFGTRPPRTPSDIVEITVAFGKRLEPWIAGVK
jgi:hypothetical protein